MQSTDVYFDPFDRGNGNGSREATDDWLDQASIFDNEWGSSAATTFDPTDTDGKGQELPDRRKKKFKRLYSWQNGKGERSRKSDIRSSHIKNDAKMFMSVLDMPDPQQKRVLNILDDLDISSNNFGSRRYEKIILALCSLVADEALTRKEDAHVDDRLFLTDEFRDLMDATRTSSSDLRKIRRDIRDKCDHF